MKKVKERKKPGKRKRCAECKKVVSAKVYNETMRIGGDTLRVNKK